jgi:hypothetical protein
VQWRLYEICPELSVPVLSVVCGFCCSGLFPWKRQGTAGSSCSTPSPGLRPPTPEASRTAPATVSLFTMTLTAQSVADG